VSELALSLDYVTAGEVALELCSALCGQASEMTESQNRDIGIDHQGIALLVLVAVLFLLLTTAGLWIELR
jgi:hypothetical protein